MYRENQLLFVVVLVVLAVFSPPQVSVAQPARHLAQGKHLAAFEQARAAELRANALFKDGKRAEANKAYRKVIEQYQRVMILKPNFLPAYIRASHIYGILGDHHPATSLLLRALTLDPDNLDLKEQLGLHQVLGRRKKKAGIAQLEAVIEARPKKLALLRILADHYRDTRQARKAIGALQRILRIRPRAHNRRVELGYAFLADGEATRALETFQAVPRDSLFFLAAQMGAGETMFALDRPAQALRIFLAAEKQIDPENEKRQVELTLRIARAHRLLGQPEQAKNRYQVLLKKAPRDARVYYGMGETLRALGRYNESRKHLQYALRLYSRSSRIYTSLARTFASLQNLSAAVANQKQAVRLAPKDWQLRAYLGELYRRQGKLDQAIGLHGELVKTRRWSADLLAQLGHDWYYKQKWDEALHHYREALRRNRSHSGAQQGIVLLRLREVHQLALTKKYSAAQQILVQLLDHKLLPGAIGNALAVLSLEQDRPREALKWLDQTKGKEGRKDTWERILLRGRALISLHQGPRALEALKAISLSTVDQALRDDVELSLATAELQANKLEEAISRFRSLSKKGVSGSRELLARALTARATRYWIEGKSHSALNDLERVVALEARLTPYENKHRLLVRALVAAETGRKRQALETLRMLKRARPSTTTLLRQPFASVAGVRLLEGYIMYRVGDFRRAARLIRPLARQKKKLEGVETVYETVLRAYAYSLFQGGQHRAAKAVFRTLRRETPKLTPADELLLACIDYRSKKRASVDTFRRLSTKIPEALLNLGIYQDQELKDKASAYKTYQTYLRRAGNHASAQVRAWVETKRRVFGFGSNQ